MIKFSCNKCGHKLGVEDEMAGKRGKCPGCGRVIVVPEKSVLVSFQCQNCGWKISALPTQSGKKGKCPNCNLTLVVPQLHGLTLLDAPAEYKLQDERPNPATPAQQAVDNEENEQEAKEETESRSKRKLPWFIDIFLYPANASGLVHIAVFVIVPTLLNLLNRLFSFGLGPRAGLLIAVFYIFLIGYIFGYFVECIRDSALGEQRASDPPSGVSSKDDLLGQFAIWLICLAFFFGPVIFYRGYIHLSNTQMNSAIFWSLLAYGVFFFPMGILSAAMFDSISGLNPLLIIYSIASTFFQYCGLVVVFAGLCLIRIEILLLMWLLFVTVHLIGRFYRRYQDKLNWEV
jgi:DNA-directed RNA polymerase subunit RPC12/RpoP